MTYVLEKYSLPGWELKTNHIEVVWNKLDMEVCRSCKMSKTEFLESMLEIAEDEETLSEYQTSLNEYPLINPYNYCEFQPDNYMELSFEERIDFLLDTACGCEYGVHDESREGQYYEAHVTIEPVFDEKREEADKIASENGFRLAKLLMQRERESTELRSDKDTFMTSTSTELHVIVDNTFKLIDALKASGFKVWRYKIEDTLIDSRYGDKWQVL